MRFRLVEDTLNEAKWFRHDFTDGKNKHTRFTYSVDASQAQQELLKVFPSASYITPVSIVSSPKSIAAIKSHPNLVITTQAREFRKEAHNVMSGTVPDTSYIHHMNEREYDQSISNLMEIPRGGANECTDAREQKFLHYAVHLLNMHSYTPCRRRFDVNIFDPTTGLPVKKQVTISIR